MGMHKIKVFTDNIFLRYFKTQIRASTKQLKWHDTLVLLDVELSKKLEQCSSQRIDQEGRISSRETLNQNSSIKGHLPRRKQP
jgi:hypothetical protein